MHKYRKIGYILWSVGFASVVLTASYGSVSFLMGFVSGGLYQLAGLLELH